MDYRQELLADIARVDDFLRIGAYLMKMHRAAGETVRKTESQEAVAETKPEAPIRPQAAPQPNALAAAFARAAAPAPAAAAQPQPAAAAEAASGRTPAFRGACDESELELRRNIA